MGVLPGGSNLRRTIAIGSMVLAIARVTPLLAWGETQNAPAASSFGRSTAAPTSQRAIPIQENPPSPEPSILRKQQKERLKSDFEKMKRDADELAELAQSLQEDLNKSNQNVLSLKILEKADKIEKLARKIKIAAKGY